MKDKAKLAHGSLSAENEANGVPQVEHNVPVRPPMGQSDPKHLADSKKIIKSVRDKWRVRVQGGENDRNTPKRFTE